jgi:hypothetical protein
MLLLYQVELDHLLLLHRLLLLGACRAIEVVQVLALAHRVLVLLRGRVVVVLVGKVLEEVVGDYGLAEGDGLVVVLGVDED